MTEGRRNPLQRFLEGPKGRKSAIHAMCWGCMGGDASDKNAGVREEIRKCTAPACPLYLYRPYQ